MKLFWGYLIVFLAMVCGSASMAQDVYISIPANTIFNRTELTTVQNVLNTGTYTSWRVLPATDPKIWSVTGNSFLHTTLTGVSLPTNVLHWRLASIGGSIPPFRSGDVWPVYKWFKNNDQQTWYEPITTLGYRTPGNVAFTFKVPSDKFAINAFHAGNYSLGVTHNYGPSGFYVVEFTPNSFNTILNIPAAISWLSNTPTKYIEISDLNDYRSTSAHPLGALGAAEIAHTIDFNLHAKGSSANIQFTSSKGLQGSRDISRIRLGSTDPKLFTNPLSANWQNYSSSKFDVKTGNRNNFTLQLSVSAADFKNYFYQAGTYTFQLNLDAKSTDGIVSGLQNTDVTIEVLPLSEITIPPSGQTVNFDFNTPAHYSQGLSKVIPNQIKLSNNENFELYVRSGTNFFKKAGIQSDVNANTLQVGIDGNSMVSLATTTQKIISNGSPVLDQELNIKYTIPAAKAQALVSKEKTTYSIDVIYSFTAL